LALTLALIGQAGPRPAAAFVATGTGTWIWQNPVPQGNTLWAVSCADGAHCVLVGDAGTVLITGNGGHGWQVGGSGTSTSLAGVSCPGAATCYAVASGGLILRSADGGMTWSAQVSGTTNALAAISCPSSTTCYAVGSGTIQATTNGGATWTAQVPPPSSSFNAISCPTATACVAVGSTAIFTTDGGTHWTAGSPAPVNTLTGVSCPNSTTCMAVGNQAAILKTTDGGATWVQLNTGAAQNGYFGISCPSTATCLALAWGAIVGTTDGGATWSMKSAFTAHGINCPSVTTCYTAGDYGAIATTGDGGTTWYSLTYAVTAEPLIRVRCPSGDTCFAVGNEGLFQKGSGPYPSVILSTNDGGKTWVKRYEISGWIGDISCPSVSTCFAAMLDSILSSSDGGATWTRQTVGATSFSLAGIDCPTTTVCYAVGGMSNSSAAVLYTTNGWGTWTLNSSVGPNDLNRISCAGVQTCVAVGYAGSTVRTSDGANWSSAASPTTQPLWTVDCPSSTACFAASTSGQIIATADSGASWALQSSPLLGGLPGMDCTAPTACVVIGGGGTIANTTNGGASWSAQNSGTTNDLYGVDCPATASCYAVGRAGTILRTPPVPPPPWWAQPVQTPATAPVLPWYRHGVAPQLASPRGSHLAPAAKATMSPGEPPPVGTTQASVSRALADLVQQIASTLQALF
jgi:photosystem II stability/assembly factor-like uncharacterized protein